MAAPVLLINEYIKRTARLEIHIRDWHSIYMYVTSTVVGKLSVKKVSNTNFNFMEWTANLGALSLAHALNRRNCAQLYINWAVDWNLVKLALIYIKRQPYPCIAYKENLIIGQHHSRKSWFFPMFTNPLPVRPYTKSKLENLINIENNKNIFIMKI